MLYSLAPDEVGRLRAAGPRGNFTDAEMLMAMYRTDPEVVAAILPKPLRPPAKAIAAAFVARYPKTDFGCVYNEGALGVLAEHRGRVGFYCVSMPVTDDMAMVYGRERLGFPKKMAEEIALEESGDRVVGRVVRKGTEILRIELAAMEPATHRELEGLGASSDEAEHAMAVTSYLFKFFPRPDNRGFDQLPRLVRQETVFRPQPGLRSGTARVVVRSSPFDPLGDIPVIGEPIAGVYGLWDNTMLPGQVVGRVWNPLRFLRHAFFKTDIVPAILGGAEGSEPGSSRDAA